MNHVFSPPFWLKNPHLQTILPKFLVKHQPKYQRELIYDSLNESQIALDFLMADNKKGDDGRFITPLIVLFHGMEGSSQSHYARTLAHHIHQSGHHFVVAHFRSCGGVAVSGQVFYNAGDTQEIHHYLSNLQKRFQTIYAVGVSLGGNALAKYMGEYGSDAVAHQAVIISAPVDLASASIAMQRWAGKYIYTPYLLNPIVKKALDNRLSDSEIHALKTAKCVSDFDEAFTAPRHGFRSKNDYYRQASALPFLIDIVKPTLIINSKDDPFLGVTATPKDVSCVTLLLHTDYGGHIGFVDYNYQKRYFDLSFISRQILSFFNL